MLRDFRVDQLGPMVLQRGQGSNLVDAHKTAIADDIGSHDRGQSAFHNWYMPLQLGLLYHIAGGWPLPPLVHFALAQRMLQCDTDGAF
jgi:hypothetical protein